MDVWKQKLKEEIELYKSNVVAINSFDKNAFIQEYNNLREELDKEIVDISVDYYEIMRECYQNYCEASSDNLSALVEKSGTTPDLKELKKNYKALLAAGEKANAEIKEINKKIKEIRAEIKPLNESINKSGIFGSLHNAMFGDYKKNRMAELENSIAEYKNRISELKKTILTDEEKAAYEADIKAGESAKRRANKNATASKTEMADNEKGIRTAYSQLIEDIENIYESYIEKLRALKTYKEYSKLLEKIDLTSSNAYINGHYSRLAQIAYICSSGLFKATLPEMFSAPCRELFNDINRYISADKQVFSKRVEWTSSQIELLNDASKITNDSILQVFGLSKKSKKKPETDVKTNASADFVKAAALLQKADIISASIIQRELKVGYARASRILDELEEAGLVGPYNGAKPRTVIRDSINISDTPLNLGGKAVLPDYIYNNLEAKLASDKIIRARKYLELNNNDINGWSLNSDFILQLESTLENTDGELPETVIELVKDDLENHDLYHSMLLKFKELYYATPEQVAIANDEYYAQKAIAQIEENARLEREMYRKQAELDRQAQRENAELMAKAERERADAINRQTSEMSYQAQLDRDAADRRSREEISAQNANAERERRERDSLRRAEESRQREAERDAIRRAYNRCKQCKHRGKCHTKGTPNCASFIPG